MRRERERDRRDRREREGEGEGEGGRVQKYLKASCTSSVRPHAVAA
jgi:hypothetical protein